MSVQQNKIRAIIEKIWSKVKEPKPMSGDGIVDAIDEVYKSGEDNGSAEAWGLIQNSRMLGDGNSRFRNAKLSMKNFRPIKDIKPNYPAYMFCCVDKVNKDEILDFSAIEQEQGISIDFSTATVLHNAFDGADIDVVNVVDARNASGTNAIYCTFGGLGDGANRYISVKRVNKFIIGEKTDRFYMTFYYANNLEHIIFEGEISKNGLALNMCTKLDKESLLSALNCLKDYSNDTSGTIWKVTFGATNLAKLTADEKAIATGKGWVLE